MCDKNWRKAKNVVESPPFAQHAPKGHRGVRQLLILLTLLDPAGQRRHDHHRIHAQGSMSGRRQITAILVLRRFGRANGHHPANCKP